MTWPRGPVSQLFAFAVVAILLHGCSQAPETPPIAPESTQSAKAGKPWFVEVAAEAGLNFMHHSGHHTRFYMPEMVTGGVGFLDFDGDGLLDVYCVDGGALGPAGTNQASCKLYRNLGGWKFEDTTARAGVGGPGIYGMGVACGDYNGDGKTDIYVTHLYGGLLFRNNGNGTFTDVTQQAGIDTKSWGTSAAFFDHNEDGHLDLIVVNYLKWSPETELTCYSRGGIVDYCSPLNYKAPAITTLYRNKGNGTFENITIEAGLGKAYGNGLGVVCTDFDHDGRVDFYVANDGVPNQLWINQGDSKFADEAWTRGCAVNSLGIPRAGMGIAAVDIRGQGWLDLFITHLVGEGNGWFVNTNGMFTDTMSAKGPNAASMPYTGFGVGFADFDHDGKLDVYIANGRVKLGAKDLDPRDPYAEPNTLLRGMGNGEFEAVTPQGGTERPLLASSRGAAFGDLDNDGSMDVVVVNKDGPVHLLRNDAPNRGKWIMFRVLDRNGNVAVNATVRIAAGDAWQSREVIPNQGYCSSNDPRLHFGIGPHHQVDRVIVRWRRGAEEAFGTLNAGTLHTIREGTGSVSTGIFSY